MGFLRVTESWPEQQASQYIIYMHDKFTSCNVPPRTAHHGHVAFACDPVPVSALRACICMHLKSAPTPKARNEQSHTRFTRLPNARARARGWTPARQTAPPPPTPQHTLPYFPSKTKTHPHRTANTLAAHSLTQTRSGGGGKRGERVCALYPAAASSFWF